jgi:hypothetical protein
MARQRLCRRAAPLGTDARHKTPLAQVGASVTYRAHCFGRRLRKAIKRRPRYPLINGTRYSWSSIEILVNGQRVNGVASIDYVSYTKTIRPLIMVDE